jgi:hypothetical protein
MDYSNYNIIKILPNIYVADQTITSIIDNTNSGEPNKILADIIFKSLNIKYLININNILDNNKYITMNINVNKNQELFESDELYNIDLNMTNDFICNALQNNSNIIICDVNNTIPFLILGAFIVKFLYLTYTETINWLNKKFNFKAKITKKIIYQIFLYFESTNSNIKNT